MPANDRIDLPYEEGHGNHGRHLCVASVMGMPRINIPAYKELIREGKYVCRGCGRVARKSESLCEAEEL